MWSLILLAALSSPALPPKPLILPRTPAQVAAAAAAEQIGQDIYDFDQAAWGSTDAMLAAIPDPGAAGIRGWIVEREPTGTIAIFYGVSGSQPYKVFVAHMQGKTVRSQHILSAGEERGLTAIEQRMVSARETATKSETLRTIGYRPCSNAPANTVVLPPASPDGAVPVYLLTPQATMDSFPLGGHYRIEVAADGSISGSRKFAKSCIAMERNRGPDAPAMLFVSHLLDPQPTEIHVWTSLASGLPMAVATLPAGDVWYVTDGKIRYQYTMPPDAAVKQ